MQQSVCEWAESPPTLRTLVLTHRVVRLKQTGNQNNENGDDIDNNKRGWIKQRKQDVISKHCVSPSCCKA
jgi:hypothetical protein